MASLSRIVRRLTPGSGPNGAQTPERELRYLVICTYGRTGSTLLQGILNSAPGVLVRGENGDALRNLHKFHQRVLEVRAEHSRGDGPLTSTSAWYGIDEYPAEHAIELFNAIAVQTLLRPEPDTSLVGYKEIRWQHAETDWRGYVDFLRAVLPGARFIFLTRDSQDVARSSWWTSATDPLADVTRHQQRVLAIAEHVGEAGRRLHYDDFVADPEVLRDLYGWLDIPFDRSAVDEVLAVRHSH